MIGVLAGREDSETVRAPARCCLLDRRRGISVNQDIDNALRGWDYKAGVIQARLVKARDGREVIQMRVDLGVLQIEQGSRPDGARPHGFPTYFAYLRDQARVAERAGTELVL